MHKGCAKMGSMGKLGQVQFNLQEYDQGWNSGNNCSNLSKYSNVLDF